MNNDHFTKKLFDFFKKNPKTQIFGFKEVNNDPTEMGITAGDIKNRNILRKKDDQFKLFEEKRLWIEESKEQREIIKFSIIKEPYISKLHWQRREELDREGSHRASVFFTWPIAGQIRKKPIGL